MVTLNIHTDLYSEELRIDRDQWRTLNNFTGENQNYYEYRCKPSVPTTNLYIWYNIKIPYIVICILLIFFLDGSSRVSPR